MHASLFFRLSTLLLLSIAAFFSTARSATGVDFVVVENVDRLQIYNKYQQEASALERQRVATFVPMKIVKTDDMLSDGFTRCMQVVIDGETFFLLKEKEGSLARTGSLGFIETFHNVTSLLDTVEILSNHAVSFNHVNSSSRQSLPANERILRIFRHGNLTYCRRLSATAGYGWMDLAEKREGRDWVVLRSATSASVLIPDDIVQKVRARVDEVNRVLARLFDHFNNQLHQQKPVPQWTLETSGNMISCLLQGTTEPDSFHESTRYLIGDIENIVLGTELQVVSSPGRIEVRQK